MGIESVLIACLPSAITGFCFWCIEQKIQKQSKKLEKEEKQRREAQDKREKLHEQQELFLVQGVNAAIALGEATARACSGSRTQTATVICTRPSTMPPRSNMIRRTS